MKQPSRRDFIKTGVAVSTATYLLTKFQRNAYAEPIKGANNISTPVPAGYGDFVEHTATREMLMRGLPQGDNRARVVGILPPGPENINRVYTMLTEDERADLEIKVNGQGGYKIGSSGEIEHKQIRSAVPRSRRDFLTQWGRFKRDTPEVKKTDNPSRAPATDNWVPRHWSDGQLEVEIHSKSGRFYDTNQTSEGQDGSRYPIRVIRKQTTPNLGVDAWELVKKGIHMRDQIRVTSGSLPILVNPNRPRLEELKNQGVIAEYEPFIEEGLGENVIGAINRGMGYSLFQVTRPGEEQNAVITMLYEDKLWQGGLVVNEGVFDPLGIDQTRLVANGGGTITFSQSFLNNFNHEGMIGTGRHEFESHGVGGDPFHLPGLLRLAPGKGKLVAHMNMYAGGEVQGARNDDPMTPEEAVILRYLMALPSLFPSAGFHSR